VSRREQVLRYCEEEIAELDRELRQMYAARKVFAGEPEEPQPPRRSKPNRGATKRAAAARSPKKSSTKRPRRIADDAPIVRKGKAPKVGVEQLLCETLADRQKKVKELKADGYKRVGPGERLTSGTFDVRPTGDDDNGVFILWRAKEVAP